MLTHVQGTRLSNTVPIAGLKPVRLPGIVVAIGIAINKISVRIVQGDIAEDLAVDGTGL